jgi:hypothetical protein
MLKKIANAVNKKPAPKPAPEVGIESLQDEITRLRHLYMDAKAVIRYLETKIDVL